MQRSSSLPFAAHARRATDAPCSHSYHLPATNVHYFVARQALLHGRRLHANPARVWQHQCVLPQRQRASRPGRAWHPHSGLSTRVLRHPQRRGAMSQRILLHWWGPPAVPCWLLWLCHSPQPSRLQRTVHHGVLLPTGIILKPRVRVCLRKLAEVWAIPAMVVTGHRLSCLQG